MTGPELTCITNLLILFEQINDDEDKDPVSNWNTGSSEGLAVFPSVA